MDTQQVVVLTDTGSLQLTSLSRHVVFHAALSLLPSQSTYVLLPRSGSRKVENLCNELPQAIIVKRRKKTSIQEVTVASNQFIQSIEIHKFLERATSVADFTVLLEKKLIDVSGGEIDPEKLHKICWNYYEMEKQSEISIPQWFSSTCTYRLWLIFCCVQEQVLSDKLPAVTANEVIKRLVELCGYTWNESYRYSESGDLDFPTYLQAIASYFTKLRLETSLTCEVIVDMVDEIVHGVLKKGYLVKKGHKRKNWKRRWFVLQRSTLKYFEDRDTMTLKGQLMLNSKTEVHGISDQGKRRCLFEVTCGHTGVPFQMSCDDHRGKHEWILAVKKAIALAKVMDGSLKQDDYTESLTGFYLLKYGTPQPALKRQDSTVRNMKYHATLKEQRKRLSGKKKKRRSAGSININRRPDSLGDEPDLLSPQEEYMEMTGQQRVEFSEDDSSDGEGEEYTPMSPLSEVKPGMSKSMELLTDDSSFDMSPLSKSLSVSHANAPLMKTGQIKLMEDDKENGHFSEEEEEGSSSDNNYDEAVILPRYSIRDRTKDPQLGGYIDVQLAGGQQRKGGPEETPLVGKVDVVQGEEGVGLLAARSVDFNKLGEPETEEIERPTTPNKYLTILRDNGETAMGGGKPPPPIPKHMHKGDHRTLNSRETEPNLRALSTSAPAPPPRSTTLVKDSSLEDRRNTHFMKRSTTESAVSSNTHHHTNIDKRTPPPLPPR